MYTKFQHAEVHGIDPFQLYLQLVNELGEGHAFLLDAAQDADSPVYQMSLIGAIPLVEIQVKDRVVSVFVVNELRNFVSQAMQASGHRVEQGLESVAQSVIHGSPLNYLADDPLAFLEDFRRVVQRIPTSDEPLPFSSGLFGYIGYDAVHYLEFLPTTTVDDRGLPDIRLQWFGTVIQVVGREVLLHDESDRLSSILSHDEMDVFKSRMLMVYQTTTAVREGRTCALPVGGTGPSSYVEEPGQIAYEDAVERAREYIRAGDIFQVVLSRRVQVEKVQHPYVAYDQLRKLNPSPYMFMAEYPDMRLFGASPEVQFRAVNGTAEMKPIAGTSKGRGRTKSEDDALREELLRDEKEIAEHVMLVDLCRNDLGRICKTGTVEVPEFLRVEPYVHLFHLVSKVTGVLREDVSVFHALVTTFPAGTLSGAPKIRAMEIIDELETVRRGPYGGLIGIIDFHGNANTAIVIRTVVESGGRYYVQVGAGIVADSQPTQEWLECGRKARAVLQVLGVTDTCAAGATRE